MLTPNPVTVLGEGMVQKLDKAMSSLDDAALVRQFQQGVDPAGAIEALFDRYATATFAFFCRSVGDRRRAEDLNQELYLEVIKGLPRFRGESLFKTWLFRLAYNHLSNLRRRLRIRVDEQPADPPTEMWGQLLPDPSDSVEKQVEDEDAAVQLRHCMAKLPDLERAVIMGRYYEETTLQELTRQLELANSSGARAYLIAGQRKLKRCMERAAAKGAASRSK